DQPVGSLGDGRAVRDGIFFAVENTARAYNISPEASCVDAGTKDVNSLTESLRRAVIRWRPPLGVETSKVSGSAKPSISNWRRLKSPRFPAFTSTSTTTRDSSVAKWLVETP